MKIALLLLLPLAVFCQVSPASASACSPEIENTMRTSGGKLPIQGELIAADCKPWRAADNTTVTAAIMAFRVEEAEDARQNWDVTGVVALVEEANGRVKQARRFTIGEDALTMVGEYSLSIDPAPYIISRRHSALGIRFSNSARPPRSFLAWQEKELTLLIPDGQSLQPVFSQVMQASRRSDDQADDWEYATLILTLGPPGASGWADIVLTDRDAGAASQRKKWKFVRSGKAYLLLTTSGQSDPFWMRLYGSVKW